MKQKIANKTTYRTPSANPRQLWAYYLESVPPVMTNL